jgi:hypothetical protein
MPTEKQMNILPVLPTEMATVKFPENALELFSE